MLFLLDPGHGGFINGEYTTAPKKMFHHESLDFTFYEGVWNRVFCEELKKFCDHYCIDYIDIVSSNEDISLRKRVEKANEIYAKNKDAVYVSIHSNAGGGTGFEVFTSPGETMSDKYATIFINAIEKEFDGFAMRKDYIDGDPDKEANFWVLKYTHCPAILVENLFFDNEDDVKKLMNKKFRRRLAYAYVYAMRKINELRRD